MRLLWWIKYWVKVKFIIFIAVLVCFIISRIFHKKWILLYASAMIAGTIVSIYVGISTFHDVDFSHPILTFIGACIINTIIDIGYSALMKRRKGETENVEEK